MSEFNDNYETEPKRAYDALSDSDFLTPEGDIDKTRFIRAAQSWTDEQEAPYETWNDDELLRMVIAMDPRDPEEFALQQSLMDIWRGRVQDRHREL